MSHTCTDFMGFFCRLLQSTGHPSSLFASPQPCLSPQCSSAELLNCKQCMHFSLSSPLSPHHIIIILTSILLNAQASPPGDQLYKRAQWGVLTVEDGCVCVPERFVYLLFWGTAKLQSDISIWRVSTHLVCEMECVCLCVFPSSLFSVQLDQ